MVEEPGLEALAPGSHFHWPGDNPVETPGLISQVFAFLNGKGVEAYIVGGFIRDTLLGRPSEDIDLAVKADSRTLALELAETIGFTFVPLDAERGVYRLVYGEKGSQFEIDISTIRGDINRDLSERDFTIDAMALPAGLSILQTVISDGKIAAGSIIDPFQGQLDLQRRILRAVSEDAFDNDPARLLRAFRLAAEMSFSIDKGTEELIRRSAHLVKNVAGERIREELLAVLRGRGTVDSLKRMDSLGLMDELFPELAPAKGVSQPGWHVYDVFVHSMVTVGESERILQSGAEERQRDPLLSYLEWDEEAERHFREEVAPGSTRCALNKLAGLFHDVAKPQTRTLTPEGFAHFYGHTTMGAEASRRILERLRFSNREINLVGIIVENHLRPTQMGDASGDGRPSKKAVYRFFRDTGEASLDVLYLSLADFLASKGEEVRREDWQANVDNVHYVLKTHKEMRAVTKAPRVLNGHDLIKEFSLSPGPLLGELLGKVEEARALGRISTRAEALVFVKGMLKDESRL